VTYALEATAPVALESLTAGTADVFAFTMNEAVDLADRNGDGDTTDWDVTLRDRSTGQAEALGAPDGFAVGGAPLAQCGIPGMPEGRAVVRISEPPFTFSAVAEEGEVVALLESETTENYCDENGDHDRADAILRVFRLGAGEVTAGLTPPRVVDPALVVNRRSLVLSSGRVFYRRTETAQAPAADGAGERRVGRRGRGQFLRYACDLGGRALRRVRELGVEPRPGRHERLIGCLRPRPDRRHDRARERRVGRCGVERRIG
jgi:hypothetical protein